LCTYRRKRRPSSRKHGEQDVYGQQKQKTRQGYAAKIGENFFHTLNLHFNDVPLSIGESRANIVRERLRQESLTGKFIEALEFLAQPKRKSDQGDAVIC